MTTNKPEIFAYRHPSGYLVDSTTHPEHYDALVLLSDYEALQARCEMLRKHLQSLIDQTTPLEPEPGNPMWSRRIQLDEVMAERDSLRAECEKLRKDAERYQSLLEAVLREIPHREGRRGNAPGHCHSVPGVWDKDNGALAGKECAWCKVWNEALTALQKEHKP